MSTTRTRLLVAMTAFSIALWSAAVVSQPKAEAFLSDMADVPLMPGLAERSVGNVVFVNAEGRIVTAHAVGPVSTENVRRFYRRALPALGWTRSGPDRYVREGERLRFEFGSRADGLMVRFVLAPADDAGR